MDRNRTLLFVALLAVPPLLIYMAALTHPFTFDDIRGIVENEAIRQLWPATWFFDAPLGTISAGRPVIGLSLALNSAIGGEQVVGYRVVNLLVHLGCGLLLFGLVRRTLQGSLDSAESDLLAFSVAILWLVHPLQNECINYISQRTTSIMALCYLGTLYAALRARDGGIGWAILAVVVCAAGMGSKPVMVSAPLMVLLYDWAYSPPGTIRRRVGLYAALASTWLILFGLLRAFPDVTIGDQSNVSGWTYALNQCQIIPGYLAHVFWPYPLVFDYGYPQPLTLGEVLPGALLVVGLLLTSVLLLLWRPKIGFVAIWLFVILGPTSSFVPIATEVGAERRMYLALASPLLLLVLLLHRFIGVKPTMWVCGGLLTLVLGATTFVRNADYRSGLRIWETAVETRPDNFRARANYSQELLDADRVEEALEQARIASELNPKYEVGRYAHGRALQALGRRDEAMREYEAALAADEELIGAELNLRQLRIESLLSARNYELAETEARRVLELVPESPVAAMCLVDALLGREAIDEALETLAPALQRDPTDPYLLMKKSDVLVTGERWDEAEPILQQLVSTYPSHVGARMRLARTLTQKSKDDEALSHLTRVLQLEPNQVEAHLLRAQALIRKKQRDPAINSLRQGLQRAPGNEALQLQLAWYLATTAGGSPLDAQQAVELAEQVRSQRGNNPRVLDVTAAAYANLGDFAQAMELTQLALNEARVRSPQLVPDLEARLRLFADGKAYRIAGFDD